MDELDTPSSLLEEEEKNPSHLHRKREGRPRRPRSLRRGPGKRTASPSHIHSSHPLKRRSTQINNTVPSLPASSVPRLPFPGRASSGGRAAGRRAPRHAPQRRGGPRGRVLGRGGFLRAPQLPRSAGLWQPGQEFPDRELAAGWGRPAARAAAAPAPRSGSRFSHRRRRRAAPALACQPRSPEAVPCGRASQSRRGALRHEVGFSSAQPLSG